MKFTYPALFGQEQVEADIGKPDEEPFIRITNSRGHFTEIYCKDLPKLIANMMLANEYVKESKQ